MPKRRKQNASNRGGAKFTKLAGGVKGQNNIFRCGVLHISKLRKEIQQQGLALRETSGATQCKTLLNILIYLGDRGLNTPEGVGLGFYRIATRIQEIEAQGWLIASRRERMAGADGLVHNGVARYVFLGRSAEVIDPQGDLDLGVAS